MIIEEKIEEEIEGEIEEVIEEEIEEVEKYMKRSISKEVKATHKIMNLKQMIKSRIASKKEKLLIKEKIEILSKTIIEVEIIKIKREKEDTSITIKVSIINLIKSTTHSKMIAEPNSTNKKIKITMKVMKKKI